MILVNLVNLVNPAILMNLLILVELAKMMNLIIFNNLVILVYDSDDSDEFKDCGEHGKTGNFDESGGSRQNGKSVDSG